MSQLFKLTTSPALGSKSTRWLLIQVVLFEAFWFVTVVGQNAWLWLSASLLVLHFALSPDRRADLLVLPIALLGWAVDSLLFTVGVFQFDSFPLWLGLLWFGFVLVLGHSLQWLRRLPLLLVSAIGAVAGTASYLGGWRLGAVELPYGLLQSTLALVLCWALLLPMLVRLDSKIRSSS